MENNNANKLIDKIINDLDETGINTNELIENIKQLRGYALEEQVPLVVKVLRLTYEHLEENNTFLIPVLEDESIEGSEFIENETNDSPVESLKYVIALTRNLENKNNIADLKEYKTLLMAY